jgi:hypothetical protein
MRQLTRIICCTTAVVALTACGSQTASTSGSQTASTAGSHTAPTSGSQPSVFPLTITRTGGIAGFHDVLVVAGDGLVSITRKGQAQRRCRLTPEAAERLTTAAAKVPWSHLTPSSTSASVADDLVTMVVSPAGGRVRLEDAQMSAVGPVFTELVNDLSGGRSSSGMCRPL